MRPTDVHRSSALLVAALLAVSVGPLPGSPATASCAGPWLETEGLTLRAGDVVTVGGRGFDDGCQDSMGCSETFGCSSCSYDDPPPEPLRDLTVRLVQGGRSWELGTADADSDGRVTWSFTVPAGVERGAARLVTDLTEPGRVRVR